MRIALLSTLEIADAISSQPRGFLRLAGATLIQHQLGLAKALGCQRVICLAHRQTSELIEAQHWTEAEGMRFNLVSGPQRLSGYVTAADELIVITEGLVADPASVAPLLDGAKTTVLSLPDDGAVADGFERLDINNAAAGLMCIPGSMVERLHDLAPDCDTISALTRIALQSGAQLRQVPPELRQDAGWQMVRSENEAIVLEGEWLRARFAVNQTPTLSDWAAKSGVLSIGASLLHRGNASNATSIATVVALVLALFFAWFGSGLMGFALAALAWVFVRATDMMRGAERHAYSLSAPAITRADALSWLVDASLVAICVLIVPADLATTGMGMEGRVFAPLVLVLILHLMPKLLEGEFSAWACDRSVLALTLALANTVGYLSAVLKVLTIGLIVAAILLPPSQKK